jgi:hypothetical protein
LRLHWSVVMEFITIPFNYQELSASARNAIVPICIRRTDRDGQTIAWGWFEAVEAVQERLRALARYRLEDEWRVSELAEVSVHKLWQRHRDQFGLRPGRRVYAQARWEAEDLRAGGWRARRGFDLALDELRIAVCDQGNIDADFERRQFVDALRHQLLSRGQTEVCEMMDMILHECSWDQIAQQLDGHTDERTVNTIQRRFWRTVKNVARLL